ncbi:haloacid dehalogenase, type II [Polytolypa hystricis UAMH7299]|uniref:Haloacid dehalogenase, type II n=1 Tax=Polytolypa hystricis (strain UAMH7299) TaxID=1447883 RepID=A0A2B7Z2X6_POLH7|nr:haloacid dehalogenase, type II [Polytolypa hystricis UAMH7299]
MTIVLVFDLYGTLLSAESIARQLGVHFGEAKGTSIAAAWRRYQLEYTWRLNSMGKYDSFSNVTKNSLRHALAEHKVELNGDSISKLMEAYDFLSTFSDVPPALSRVAASPDITAVVFSNGTPSMINNSVLRSQDLSPHAGVFKDIISIDPVQKFKPTPDTYWYLADKVGKQRSEMEDMWLISGNPFDVMGAMNVGMKAAWVDRAGLGWMDAMNGDTSPTIVARNLDELIQKIIEGR